MKSSFKSIFKNLNRKQKDGSILAYRAENLLIYKEKDKYKVVFEFLGGMKTVNTRKDVKELLRGH